MAWYSVSRVLHHGIVLFKEENDSHGLNLQRGSWQNLDLGEMLRNVLTWLPVLAAFLLCASGTFPDGEPTSLLGFLLPCPSPPLHLFHSSSVITLLSQHTKQWVSPWHCLESSYFFLMNFLTPLPSLPPIPAIPSGWFIPSIQIVPFAALYHGFPHKLIPCLRPHPLLS